MNNACLEYNNSQSDGRSNQLVHITQKKKRSNVGLKSKNLVQVNIA